MRSERVDSTIEILRQIIHEIMREKIFVTVGEAAEMMSVSEDTIHRMVHRGELESVKIGSLRRIRVESIREFGKER